MVDKDRKSILWKARNAALQTLAARHPEEFIELKNEFLRKWGHSPIARSGYRGSKFSK